jgi:hypothetical protein
LHPKDLSATLPGWNGLAPWPQPGPARYVGRPDGGCWTGHCLTRLARRHGPRRRKHVGALLIRAATPPLPEAALWPTNGHERSPCRLDLPAASADCLPGDVYSSASISAAVMPSGAPGELTKRAAPVTALALCAGFPVPLLLDLCIAGLAIATSERMVAPRTARRGRSHEDYRGGAAGIEGRCFMTGLVKPSL